MLATTLQFRWNYSHFISDVTEPQRCKITCLKEYPRMVVKLRPLCVTLLLKNLT